MSPKSFKDIFLDNVLNFLWRQWSALGVLGEAQTQDPWLIDVEPMLIFSLEMGRFEPRLFDEVIDWLVINGKWIDLQRLRGILRGKKETTKRLLGAVAAVLNQKSNERKWQNLAQFIQSTPRESSQKIEPLFIKKDGAFYPTAERPDSMFLSFGFNRPPVTVRKMSRPVPVTSQTTLRFLLRAFFGVGSRAECLAYLLTHDGGYPSEVAKAIGLSVRGAQDTLIDLARSGLVLSRIKGRRKIEYWLSHERWWEFLSKGSIMEVKRPVWLDWIALYEALSKVWTALNEISKEGLSDYMRSSKLRDAMEIIGNEFLKSGLDISLIPEMNIKPLEYEKAFETFITKIFGS